MLRRRLFFAAFVLLLVAEGCDPSVDTFRKNELHYSVFGYLNASADTQFVRVEPLRDSLLDSAPETLEVEVNLTNRSTGHPVTLQDSLFRVPDRHNFYTASEINPATPYRLVVQGPNGAESRVETTVPARFPTPEVVQAIPACFPSCRDGPPSCNVRRGETESRYTTVSVEDVDRLVSVRAIYYMEQPRGVWTYGHLADTLHTQRRAITAAVDYGDDWCHLPEPESGRKRLERVEVAVAAGSPDWPEFLRMEPETELLPGVGSNVEDGVGFLGGIVTDTVVVYGSDE